MKTALTHLFTGKDNRTLDIGRVGGALALLDVLAISNYHVITTGQFDYLGMAGLIGGTLTAVGALLKLKADTEPDAAPPAAGGSP